MNVFSAQYCCGPQTPCLIRRGRDLDLQIGALGPPTALLLQQVPVWRPPGYAVADDLDLGGVCKQTAHQIPYNAPPYNTPPDKATQRNASLRSAQRYFKDTRSAFAVLHPGLQSFIVQVSMRLQEGLQKYS